MTERQHRDEAERDRETREDRAHPVQSGEKTPFHGGDHPDALRPDKPVDPPPDRPEARRDPEEEGDPTEGHPA